MRCKKNALKAKDHWMTKIRIAGLPLISEAHSDWVGLCFGLLVSVAAILVILMAAGVVRLPCTTGDDAPGTANQGDTCTRPRRQAPH